MDTDKDRERQELLLFVKISCHGNISMGLFNYIDQVFQAIKAALEGNNSHVLYTLLLRLYDFNPNKRPLQGIHQQQHFQKRSNLAKDCVVMVLNCNCPACFQF